MFEIGMVKTLWELLLTGLYGCPPYVMYRQTLVQPASAMIGLELSALPTRIFATIRRPIVMMEIEEIIIPQKVVSGFDPM